MQALPSSQLAGQEAGGSQVSPLSTTLLPQLAEQSVSVVGSQPAGQQPSPGVQVAMAAKSHTTLQVSALPNIWSAVQALPSSQLAGQEAAGSQVSPESTTPLPQVAPGAPAVAELPDPSVVATPPVAPPLLVTPPVPPAPLVPAEAPPPPDWVDELGVSEHDMVVAA